MACRKQARLRGGPRGGWGWSGANWKHELNVELMIRYRLSCSKDRKLEPRRHSNAGRVQALRCSSLSADLRIAATTIWPAKID